MNRKSLCVFFLYIFFSLVLPFHALAQCKDQLCRNLQNLLDAAVTDFREYRSSRIAVPDASIPAAKVPCQMTAWANNVPMLMCYAQVPEANAESWYLDALPSLQTLQPSWHFKIDSPAADHFVDAGLPDCQLPDREGPYLGHCPLHLQITKQNDGTAKIYLWMSSLSSPYLMNRPPDPPQKAAPAGVGASNGCDDLCQGLKKAFEARANSFDDLRAAKTNSATSEAAVTLAGATQCAIKTAAGVPHSDGAETQFVCYWMETSAPAGETRFRDLISRLQILVPSTWAIRQEDQFEELTGIKATAWLATAPDAKQEIALYLSNQSVGIHIRSSK